VEDEFAVHNLYNAAPELLTQALAREGKKRRRDEGTSSQGRLDPVTSRASIR
jgi:hypothetical protein